MNRAFFKQFTQKKSRKATRPSTGGPISNFHESFYRSQLRLHHSNNEATFESMPPVYVWDTATLAFSHWRVSLSLCSVVLVGRTISFLLERLSEPLSEISSCIFNTAVPEIYSKPLNKTPGCGEWLSKRTWTGIAWLRVPRWILLMILLYSVLTENEREVVANTRSSSTKTEVNDSFPGPFAV